MKFIPSLFLLFIYINCSAQTPLYRLKKETIYNFENNIPKLVYNTQYEYSGNRQGIGLDAKSMVSAMCEHDINITPVLYYDTRRSYQDSLGNSPRSTISRRYDNGDRLVYEYSIDHISNNTGEDTLLYQGDSIIQKRTDGSFSSISILNSMGLVVKYIGVPKNQSPTVTTYTYDNAGNLTGRYAPIYPGNKSEAHLFEYDNMNRRTRHLVISDAQQWPADTIIESQFHYNNLGTVDTVFSWKRNDFTQTLDTSGMRVYLYNAAQQINEVMFYSYFDTIGAYDTINRYLFECNSFGFVSLFHDQYYDSAGNWGHRNGKYDIGIIRKYDYELTWPTTVPDENYSGAEITIYPTPTHDVITIQATFTQPQSIIATITDMQGRLMRSWSEPSTKEYRRTIPVADLPAGNYVLKVNGMVKQFVVR